MKLKNFRLQRAWQLEENEKNIPNLRKNSVGHD